MASDEHQASQQASADAWLDDLISKHLQDIRAGHDAWLRDAVLAHLQEREAAAELRERLIRAETNLATLQGLDVFIRWEKPDQLLVEIARRLKLAQAELLAVEEGRK